MTVDLISYLRAPDPFSNNTSLSNIANGMSAHEGVTSDHAREIGENILSSMVGQSVDKYNHTENCNFKSFVKLTGKTVNVDPQLIFQRLITVGV